MTELDEQGRPEPPPAGDEAATLLGFLDFQRATLAWKARGLDADQLSASIHPTTMTLGGLLKHMALVEDQWFGVFLRGGEPSEPWKSVDWDADRDWDWHSAADDSVEVLWGLWEGAVERSRAAVTEALDTGDGDFGVLARRRWRDGRTPSLRWIVTHMIEEYARHNGHADLLREAIDGQTGE